MMVMQSEANQDTRTSLFYAADQTRASWTYVGCCASSLSSSTSAQTLSSDALASTGNKRRAQTRFSLRGHLKRAH